MGGGERPERRGNERRRHRRPQCNGGAGIAGLPPPRPRLAGSAVHPRLAGGDQERRAPRRASARTGGHRRRTKTGTPSEAAGTRCWVGLRSGRRAGYGAKGPTRNRAHRPAARAGAPAGPSAGRPHSVRLRQ